MLGMLLATYALIGVARHAARHRGWYFDPVTKTTFLGAVLGALVAIGLYTAASRKVAALAEHGPIVLTAALFSGIGCAFVVCATERDPGVHDYTKILSTAGQITAAILIAFVIGQRFLPTRSIAPSLDVVGFAFIVTSMGTAILGGYPIDSRWQAALAVVTCMGAGAGIATLALRASELALQEDETGSSG